LIELLVVIGIITVLISMLLPAINRAMTQARAVQCTSNLLQIRNALVLYSLDHRQWLPSYRDFDDDDNPATPYVRKNWYHVDYIGKYAGARRNNQITGTVFECSESEIGADHAYAYRLMRTQSDKADWIANHTRLPQVVSPATKLILADGTTYFTSASFIKNSGCSKGSTPGSNNLWARHRGFANVLFLDWHVEQVPVFKPELQDTTGMNLKYQLAAKPYDRP